MNYLKLSTMEYPVHEGDIRLEYPEITEDQTGDTFPLPNTYVKVQEVTPPQFEQTSQYVITGQPEQVDGIWRQVWIVCDRTQEQLKRIKEEQNIGHHRRPRPSTDLNGSAPDVIA